MKNALAIGTIVLLLTGGLYAATAAGADEHAAHYPAGPASSASAPADFDRQMRTMNELHQKMLAAKTPDERESLMKEHMKAMQDGMGMMGQMHGGMMGGKEMEARKDAMPMSPEMMKRRMDMMEMMMQLMVDRESMVAPQSK